ncbi:histidine kinase [Desulfocapsa sulfexigens DSM 10523]|uniref:histidine kinase n=1 Tax=Desulfocapsa sulfexigens (strain DSM 10523 / SB164P1) TaxID=1167006 RepID=M1NCV1_DESSD|nr:GAF domain-containing protein [Desulfocapsa sulfexigens]AGF77574.1 histidine kinase [Desulfocapsa sulfexigens DSM 10523]
MGKKNITGVVYNEISTAFFDLLAGKVDAFIYPKPVALKLARDAGIDGNIKIVGENLAEIKRAIRVRKGDKLLARLNPAVNEFLRSPEYKKIYGKWYGEPEPFLSIRRLTVASAVLLVTITVSLLLWRFNTIQKLNREQEHIIDERTKKLIEANTLLQKEIGERKKKEKALLKSENGLKEAQHLGKMGSWDQSEELLKRETARSQFLLDLYLKSNVLNDSEVYEYVMDEAVKLTDSKIGYLHVINEDQQTITLTLWNKEALKECTTVPDNHHPIVKGGIWADSIRQKKLVIHNTYQSHPDKKGYPEGHSHLTRHMSVPVLEEDQVRLVFGVGNKSQNYDESDVKTLQIVANELQKIIVQRHNIEQRRTLEAQLRQTQKMEAIGTLAGGIAHDFNNILTAIIGYTEITIGDLAPDSRAASDLQQVLNAGNRAKELVKQILSFSRQAEQELQPLRPQLLVKEALKLLRSSIPSTIEVKENIDPECGAVLADPTQIHQIIMNLCTNAYHAMRETGGVLGVSVTPVELGSDDLTTKMHLTAGIYVKFEVSDTGCGMDKMVLEKIFDPYYTTKGKKEGTGLGLSVVHGIVKSLHGDITVYSSLGEGTTFRVYIPMVDTEAKKVLQAAITRQLPSGDEHVLIVDDDEAIVKMEEQMLKSFGYQVSAFNRCEEALNEFRSHPNAFDLIITDMTMPGITGLQLTREVLALRSDMPVILCTGFSELINEKKAKDAGICQYLMKPLLKKDLAIAVREVLDKKAKKQIL